MKVLKWLVLVVVILYVVSPIDFLPGPIDDIIIAVMGIAANRKMTAISAKN